MVIVKTGDTAKDFTLNDQDGNEFHLTSLKGKRVLLSFHPLAWTKVCAEQMKSLEKNRERFEKLNTVAVGIYERFISAIDGLYFSCSELVVAQ